MGCGASKPAETPSPAAEPYAAPAAAPPAAPAAAEYAAADPSKKGYVYGFFDMKDPAEFKNVYSPMAEPTLDPYEGKFVMKHALAPPLAAKMGMKESKGFGTTGMMAFMLEFPSFDKAMGWFTGPEYAAVLTKRDEVADFKMAVVEGAPIAPGAGLVLGFFDMKDPAEFKNVYSPMAEPTLDPYGGKFAIKYPLAPPLAAKMGVKESKGFGTTGMMAFALEFETFEKAMGWFTGPEYAAVTGKRDEVSDFRMAVCEAMGGSPAPYVPPPAPGPGPFAFASGLPDCCTASPDLYKTIADIEGVARLVEMTFPPGAKDLPHEHPVHNMYFLVDCKLKISGPPTPTKLGEEGGVAEVPAGAAPIFPAMAHQVENVGDCDGRAVFVEAFPGCKPCGDIEGYISPFDVSPGCYKILEQDDNWITGMLTMEVGEKDDFHHHKDHLIYVIEGDGVTIYPGGDEAAAMVVPLKVGAGIPAPMAAPPFASHTLLNSGTVPLKMLFFEAKK